MHPRRYNSAYDTHLQDGGHTLYLFFQFIMQGFLGCKPKVPCMIN